MKVVQDKVFQSITLTIESLDELKLIAAALCTPDDDLKVQWQSMGFEGSIDTNISFGMWSQVTGILENNQ